MIHDLGFITMAFGSDKYFRQAESLARSLRRHMPGFPIAIVTDRNDVGPLFDIKIPVRKVKVAGTLLKADLYEYSPFRETLFIDSDCIVAKPFHEELQDIRKFDFSPVVTKFLSAGDTDLWIKDIGVALSRLGGTPFPKFNGGVYFFRKGEFAQSVFYTAGEIYKKSDILGILDFDKAGPGEETLIGLALSQMRVENFYNDGGRLMRTPLNSQGPIHLDVIEGTCSFVKQGKRVDPAICHFCGEWVDHPAYVIAQQELLAGQKINGMQKAFIHFLYNIRRMIDRVKQRLFRSSRNSAT